MKTSYKPEDVIVLLKDITGELQPLQLAEREKQMKQGIPSSGILPLEYQPSKAYMALYQQILSKYSRKTAYAIIQLADKIIAQKGTHVTLVSLARTGTPIGILLKRYILKRYNINVPHYTISFIPSKGIDHNAMQYILGKHKPEMIQLVDGWTKDYNISNELAVLSDPAHLTSLYGTREDFLIPSACLGSTISGLLSRTVLNSEIFNENDFHGAAYFAYLEDKDVSYQFIESIEKHFDDSEPIEEPSSDIITSSINETIRCLLYTSPTKILVRNLSDTRYIEPILQLAKDKQIPIEEYPLQHCRVRLIP